jgi:hypothetical protein
MNPENARIDAGIGHHQAETMLYDEQARWRTTTRFDSDSTTSTNRGSLSNSWASSIALSEGETVAISVEEGLKRAARPVDSIERMIEVKVSIPTRTGQRRTHAIGRPSP